MKIDIRCGVFDGGKPCGNSVGTIERDGFPGPQWFRGGNYDRLRWEERHYACDKHGDLQIHDEDPAAPGAQTQEALLGHGHEGAGDGPSLNRTAQRAGWRQA